jgi:hypothetical protein
MFPSYVCIDIHVAAHGRSGYSICGTRLARRNVLPERHNVEEIFVCF